MLSHVDSSNLAVRTIRPRYVCPSYNIPSSGFLLFSSHFFPSLSTLSFSFTRAWCVCCVRYWDLMECDSKRIQRVHLYKPKLAAGFGKRRFRLYHVVFLLCYIYQVIYVVSTIGQPYRQFLEKADRDGFQGKYENCTKEYGNMFGTKFDLISHWGYSSESSCTPEPFTRVTHHVAPYLTQNRANVFYSYGRSYQNES
jgi:hypothetical protein